MKKTQIKKNKGRFEKIAFMFDNVYGIEISVGDTKRINYLGVPIKFFTRGRTLVVDMSDYLWRIENIIEKRYEENTNKKSR